MVKAIRIHQNGSPDVMRWEDIELPALTSGQVLVRHTAIAVNFSDINIRRGGFYISRPQQFPLIPGNEAAGVVAQVGTDVTGVREGDRVAYVGTGGPFYEETGSYAEARIVPAHCLVKLPAAISEQVAAAFLLKGLTAAMIINRVFRPQPGQTILVHAAASGVGLLLAQWAAHLGATVIGTVGSADKAAIARAYGCAHTINYREADFVAAVKRIVPEGVAAVFDGVGKDTFIPSLDCTRRFGMLVNYGNASGHVPPLDLLLLAKKGSLSVSRPGFSSYIAGDGGFQAACAELFDLLGRGVLKVEVTATYPLREAAQAHRDIEARDVAGAVILQP